jgi:hypothetical protein
MMVKKIVTGLILGIIGIVVIFYIIGSTAGTLTEASGNISTSGLPLANLFSSNGVVLLIIMAGVLLAVIGLGMGFAKIGK